MLLHNGCAHSVYLSLIHIFLGIGSKPAVIQARKKCSVEDYAREFLNNVFAAMKLEVDIACNGTSVC